jgi:maltooligosyltrehalose trehalohydrolase
MPETFRVWAPRCERVDVHVISPFDKVAPLERSSDGYFSGAVDGVEPGARYFFRLDGERERPDPASRFQPEGVHGPSEVVASEPVVRLGRPLNEYVIYEAHVGTLTRDGTFASAIEVLDDLVDLGFTALELMPIAQFPGERNWGYDGVFPYAPQNSYGGPSGLRRLVRACHNRGIAVVLDAVYNHMGPEGCVLEDFGPFFTDRHRTPWGRAIAFDEPAVREFLIANAVYWFEEFGIDALRLDAVHAIWDKTFLAELAERTDGFLIAENETNDPRLTDAWGLDARWNDGFHHALIAYVTGDRERYLRDYGSFEQVARAIGEPDPGKLVVFAANHDQIGNRALGDRLATRVDQRTLKLLAAAVLLSPSIPLVFMGEEYGETNPFQYFVSHSDPGLVDAVRKGRRGEFPSEQEPPDPQDPATFERSKLDRQDSDLRAFYKEMIALRTKLGFGDRPKVRIKGDALVIERERGTIVLDFS